MANAVYYVGEAGETVTLRIRKTSSTVINVAFTAGTGAATNFYHVDDAAIIAANGSALAAGEYPYAIFSDGSLVGSGILHWDGANALPPAADASRLMGKAIALADAGAANLATFFHNGNAASDKTIASVTTPKNMTITVNGN